MVKIFYFFIAVQLLSINLVLSQNTFNENDSTIFSLDKCLKHRYNQELDYSLEPTTCPSFSFETLHIEAQKHIGTPYLAGGKKPGGFDCSGFAAFLFKPFGIYLPYSSSLMSNIGSEIELKNAQPGDLILFKGFNIKDVLPGHVATIVSKKGEPIKFVHSTSSKGVRYDFLKNNSYFESRFVSIRRVVD